MSNTISSNPQAGPCPQPSKDETRAGAEGPLEGILRSSAQAAESQVAIWKLQIAVAAARLVAVLVLACLFISLGIYGFLLLDEAARVVLNRFAEGYWFSPLARGGAYCLASLLVLWPVLKIAVSADSAETKGSKHVA